MRRHSLEWLMAMVFAALPAWAGELNALRVLKVVPQDASTQLILEGSRVPNYTVFRSHEPERLVIDVASADASAIKGFHEGSGVISGVVVTQFQSEPNAFGRILISLQQAASYEVKTLGNRLIVSLGSKADLAAPKPLALMGPSSQKLTEPSQAQAIPSAPSASKLAQLRLNEEGLTLSIEGATPKYDVLELKQPARLVIDLFGLQWGGGKVPKGMGPVREVRVGPHAGKVRLVLDLATKMPRYQMHTSAQGLELRWEDLPKKPAQDAEEPEFIAEIDGKRLAPAHTTENASVRVSGNPVTLQEVNVQKSASGASLYVSWSAATRWKVERPDAQTAVLNIENASLPAKWQKTWEPASLPPPLSSLSSFQLMENGFQVRLVVASEGALDDLVEADERGLRWKLKHAEVPVEHWSLVSKVAPEVVDSKEENPAEEAPASKRSSKYSGKKISFEFKDIDVHNLLRIIAEVSKKNIVVADDVAGKVTIRLRNVPWDQALDLILRSKSLGQEDLGNIIRVAPLRALEEEAKLREERKKSIQRQEELLVQLIPVNYATASEMASRVKEILSERGSVAVDVRTNTLIIRDISSSISKARGLVRSLDTPTPQVLIESRIVEANTNFTRQVGIQWGGNGQMAQSTGNSTGLIFPNTVLARGGSSTEAGDGVGTPPNFAVNLPAAVGTGAGGALGLVFGSAGGALALNLRLSALENQGAVKTISAPKVTTLDNSPARISQGVSIPFSQVSAGGVNTTFVEARLSLEVTPHITSDGSILMTIKAENNQPDPGNTGANGQPAIQRKEANTQVLVRDGDTTVIGGIYVRRGANSVRELPFLGKIPILGFFFRNVTETDTRQELLIFITPRIIHQQMAVQGP